MSDHVKYGLTLTSKWSKEWEQIELAIFEAWLLALVAENNMAMRYLSDPYGHYSNVILELIQSSKIALHNTEIALHNTEMQEY